MGWLKFQKGWGCQKGAESSIKGEYFFLFLSIKTYFTFCCCYSCFSKYYTKKEIPRIKLMVCCFKYYGVDTSRVLKYFLNIDFLTFFVCERREYPGLTVNYNALFCFDREFTMGWSTFQKRWRCQKGAESNITRKYFSSLSSIKTYFTFCCCYSYFFRYFTKREMPKIKLMIVLLF